VGKKLKAAGHPYGQTAGHTFGDAPGWWYPYLWSWGGNEVAEDGKAVVLNSKETIESVKFAVLLWKETMLPDRKARLLLESSQASPPSSIEIRPRSPGIARHRLPLATICDR